MKAYISFLVIVFALIASSCGGGKNSANGLALTEADSLGVAPRYAKGYSVKVLDNGVRLIDVADPQDDEEKMPVSYHFALVDKGMDVEVPEGYTKVEVPIERTLVMTMLQLSNFTALDALDIVRGITGTKNLFNKDIRQRVKDGRMVKIGMEGNFDTELILAAHPEVIFISPFKRGGYDAIKETGITLIPHLGYKELTPLGQAEWIRFVGLFIGKEHEADSIFAGIEHRYNELKEKVQCSTPNDQRPSIFSGDMKGGAWYATGGKSYLATIFRDAGARYVLEDNQDAGGVNMDFEAIYAKAADVDYWRISNSFNGTFTYDVLAEQDSRFCDFKAYRLHHVIYSNMSQTPFYESFPVHPDLVLSDFVKIFYPQLLPDYTPTYYKLLE